MSNRTRQPINENVAAGVTKTVDIDVGSADSVLIAWVVTDSAAQADLGATTLRALTATTDDGPGFLIDNVISGSPVATVAKVGSQTSKLDRYDVRGLEKVRLSLTNASGSTRNMQAHVFLDN